MFPVAYSPKSNCFSSLDTAGIVLSYFLDELLAATAVPGVDRVDIGRAHAGGDGGEVQAGEFEREKLAAAVSQFGERGLEPGGALAFQKRNFGGIEEVE